MLNYIREKGCKSGREQKAGPCHGVVVLDLPVAIGPSFRNSQARGHMTGSAVSVLVCMRVIY